MDGDIQGLEVLSPLQAALLRGFARKRLKEQQGTYRPLMGDPEKDTEVGEEEWTEEDEEGWEEDEVWLGSEDIAGLTEDMVEDLGDASPVSGELAP